MNIGSPIPPGIVSVEDYIPHARERMGANAWAYISGGAADERTLAWNREAYDRLKLNGRVLADMAGANTRLTLFGETLEHPVILAPVALHRLAHPAGEIATVLGASAAKAPMVVSTEASVTLEDIARSAQTPLWFQLYIQQDRGFTVDLVRRAEQAGYRALVVTVDAPVNGIRNREQRAGFRCPEGISCANLRDAPAAMPPAGEGSAVFALMQGAAVWRDIEWLGAQTRLPVILKGIMSPRDAVRAIDAGAQGIVVSNHGGRTLDTLPASIEVLPSIAERVDGRIPLLFDGGVRRGTDILKALALGARAVLIGRPQLYGLAVSGAAGVAHIISMLRAELEVAMALTGCRTVADIDRSVLWEI